MKKHYTLTAPEAGSEDIKFRRVGSATVVSCDQTGDQILSILLDSPISSTKFVAFSSPEQHS